MGVITAEGDARAERREKYHEGDVVVVGAGIFGCAVAHALADQGRSVLLLERWMKEPDRIVGELLQPGGVAALRRLGLAHCLDGIDAVPCHGYNVIYHGDPVVIPYPRLDATGHVLSERRSLLARDTRHKSHGGPANANGKRPEGRSFHHGRFIAQLRKACAAHRNITMFETEVTATIRGESSAQILGVESRTVNPATGEKEADCFFGGLTIIADGYASKFRKQVTSRLPLVRSKFYALELIDCPLPDPGYGHVVIGQAFPVLLYQIGSRETRALIDVPDKIPEASPAAGGVRGYIRNTVVPTLPAQLRPFVLEALDRDGGKIPRSMPNSWLPASKQTRVPGLVVLGDANNMRHPLTGGGMTVAFNDVILLAELLSPENVPHLADADAVAKVMRTFHWRRKAWTAIINVLAQALYSLFAANDRELRALQLGCFGYFQMGITDEPVAMLGGVLHKPLVLAYHFFSVAFLALWMNALQVMGGSVFGILKAPLALVDAVLILWKACVVFLPVFYRELM